MFEGGPKGEWELGGGGGGGWGLVSLIDLGKTMVSVLHGEN